MALTKKSSKKNHSQIDILWQFNNKKNVRDDLIDKMEDCVARRITFAYANKKWMADRNRGVIYEMVDNRDYSIKNLNLKAGDIILWGEFNWYCTSGNAGIVCMEKYLKTSFTADAIEDVDRVTYKRQRCTSICYQGMSNTEDHVGNGSQMCQTQPNVVQSVSEVKMNMEHDEDLVEVICKTNRLFFTREMRDLDAIFFTYLPKPLNIGDIIKGPSPNGVNTRWIVSKKWILRRTYDPDNVVNRHDIKIQQGGCFHVGENFHYATKAMSRYILVDSYMSGAQLLNDMKQYNKKKRREQLTAEKYEIIELE